MNTALIDDFLNDSTFLGKFCSTFMQRQEFKLYLSMLLNPIILSIENENEECLDMSLITIRDYINKKSKEKKGEKNMINNDNTNINKIQKNEEKEEPVKQEEKQEPEVKKV